MSILSKLLGRSSRTPPTDLPVKGEGEPSEAGFMHFKDSPIVGEGQSDPGLAAPAAEGSDQTTVADSFGFGVEREMKESGEKGGTEDINIGVGELQEATISRQTDAAPGDAGGIAGEAPPSTASYGDAGEQVYLAVKLENVQVSGDGTLTTEEAEDSFDFGVEREMKESGEKGGSEDINIGVGELQETVVSKPMDAGADGGVFVASGEADTAAPARVVKEWDASSPGLMQDEDSEGSTLAALEVQEPEAIGPAAGAASEEHADADDFDLDLEDDGDIDA